MTIPSQLNDLLVQIETTSDYDEKCDLLIEFAGEFKECERSKYSHPYDRRHQVPGCESEVYLWVIRNSDQSYTFDVIVENPQGISAKALAQILKETLGNCSAEEIASIPDEVVYRIFGEGLSMGKGQGLMGMIRLLKQLVKEA